MQAHEQNYYIRLLNAIAVVVVANNEYFQKCVAVFQCLIWQVEGNFVFVVHILCWYCFDKNFL